MIRSKLFLPTGEPVRFDYILRNGKDGWRASTYWLMGQDLALKRVRVPCDPPVFGFDPLRHAQEKDHPV